VTVCKDGTPIPADGGRITLRHVDRQVLVQVNETTPDDTGEYTVTAVNECGKVYHAVTVVVVPAAVEYVIMSRQPLFLFIYFQRPRWSIPEG